MKALQYELGDGAKNGGRICGRLERRVFRCMVD